ncbi:MAG: methionine--tRNA ligase [bacterium]|nr:methionine--tRNA ligase [bacterium]
MAEIFYVTTPLYYPNAAPHIGSTYTTTVADTLVRYHRAAGENCFLLTGIDEHGEKMVEAAEKEGLTPQAFVDGMAERFRSTWDTLGLKYDRFIRTTDADHKQAVRTFWQTIYDRGEIELREYTGRYCVGCERYLTERELDNGRCTQHDAEPEERSEANYFFKMSNHFEWLIGEIEANPQLITPERYRNEVLSTLKSGALEDLCITRPRERLSWGIAAPWDEDYTIYVWIDALVNYLTGIGYPDGENFESHWAGAHHLIAKDILKPHGIFWPTMLHAAGVPLYQGLHVHGYWNMENTKISKSLGNLVDPLVMRDKYGFPSFRYYILRDMSWGLDSDFSEESLIQRVNADLANDLGNLLNRSISMLAKYCDGVVPEYREPGDLSETAVRVAQEVDRHIREFSTQRALSALWELLSAANKYVDSEAPWALAKDPEKRAKLEDVMYELCESLRVIAVLLESFLPETSLKIMESLGEPICTGTLAERLVWGQLSAGTQTKKIEALFPRIETE